jgi:hypothetical protein
MLQFKNAIFVFPETASAIVGQLVKKTQFNSILYTKVEKFMTIARAPRLDARREGYKGLLHGGLYTIFFITRYVKALSNNNNY